MAADEPERNDHAGQAADYASPQAGIVVQRLDEAGIAQVDQVGDQQRLVQIAELLACHDVQGEHDHGRDQQGQRRPPQQAAQHGGEQDHQGQHEGTFERAALMQRADGRRGQAQRRREAEDESMSHDERASAVG